MQYTGKILIQATKCNQPSRKGCVFLSPAEFTSVAGQEVQHGAVEAVLVYDNARLLEYAKSQRHTLELNKQGAVEYQGGAIPGRIALCWVYLRSATARLVTVWDYRCFDPKFNVKILSQARCVMVTWTNLHGFRTSELRGGNYADVSTVTPNGEINLNISWRDAWRGQDFAEDHMPVFSCWECDNWIPHAY